jgi:hypothetical protein
MIKQVTGVPKSVENLVIALQGEYGNPESDLTASQLGLPAKSIYLTHLARQKGSYTSQELARYEILRHTFGTVLHKALQQYAPAEWLTETRLYKDFQVGDKTIKFSGQLDAYNPNDNTLIDYKYTSYRRLQNGELPREYILQGLANAYLLIEHGLPVDRIIIFCFISDAVADTSVSYECSLDELSIVVEVIESLANELSTITEDSVCTLEDKAQISYKVFANADSKRASRVVQSYDEAKLLAKTSNHIIKVAMAENGCEFCGGKVLCNEYRTVLKGFLDARDKE